MFKCVSSSKQKYTEYKMLLACTSLSTGTGIFTSYDRPKRDGFSSVVLGGVGGLVSSIDHA